MEQRNKFIETGSGYDHQGEKLKFEDMDLLYENFPSENYKHSLSDYFKSISTFLKFLSVDINYSTNLINKLLLYLQNNRNKEDADILINAVNSENRILENFIELVSDFFENQNNIELEKVNFNRSLDDILIKIAEYTEEKKVSIFKKFDADVNVQINKEKFYLACRLIFRSWCENIEENGKIFVTTKRNDNKVEIKFKDNISGIPDEILKYIFEPSTPLEYEWEFGLVLANKIINDHCGKISVSR